MSKQDDMRRLIDLANGKQTLNESQSADAVEGAGSPFSTFKNWALNESEGEFIVRLTDPKGATFYVCYDAPGYTPEIEKATKFTNSRAAHTAANSTIYGDSNAFWNSERTSAANTAQRMRGWKADVEPVNAFEEAWAGEPASIPNDTKIWQDKDPMGEGKWFWTRAVDGHVVARGSADTQDLAIQAALGDESEVEEDLLAEPAVLDEDDFHNDNDARTDDADRTAEISSLVQDGFVAGSGGGHDGAAKFAWTLDLTPHELKNNEHAMVHIAKLIGAGEVEGADPTWQLFVKTWHDKDFAEGLAEEDHEFEDSYFNIDEKDDLARIAWLIHDGQDQGFAPEWNLHLSGREVLQGGLPAIKPDERNAIAQAVRGGKLEGMLHTGEKWTVTADLELNETTVRHAPAASTRSLPTEVPHHVKGSKFVTDMETWQAGKMSDEEFRSKWDGRKKTAVGESADSELEYENDPDDGHEHEWVDPDFDMGVPNAVMCSKCGEMSVSDDEDHEDHED